MASKYRITEDSINDAVNALNDGRYFNPTAAERAFGVPPSTVQQRLQRTGSRSTQPPTNRALSAEQEQSIRDYIQRLEEQNISAKILTIHAAANYLLEQSHFDKTRIPHQVSENWTWRFLERNPQFHKRKQKPLSVERKNAYNEEDFKEYFEKYWEIRV